MPSSDLAILVPAWKPDFLEAALASILAQTDSDFRVYVGDDAGPPELARIVERYASDPRLSYHRFDTNMGGRDLVGQWNRCLDLVGNEEWIWLFSDDDLMDPDCVRAFRESRQRHGVADLFHFPVVLVDQDAVPMGAPHAVNWRTPQVFLEGRLRRTLESYAVENVFRRSRLREMGGIPAFDLAWCSDDALWVGLSSRHPSVLVEGPSVRWRRSSVNISPTETPAIARRKLASRLDYCRWVARNVPVFAHGEDARLLFHWFHSGIGPPAGHLGQKAIANAVTGYARTVRARPLAALGWWMRLAFLDAARSARVFVFGKSTGGRG